jgi:hypothetical protein
MSELSLNEVIFLSKCELNKSRLLFEPNSFSLATDFMLSANIMELLQLLVLLER